MSDAITKENVYDVIRGAFIAAKDATSQYIIQHGEPFYCGFAWVNIKPGNCRIANVLKQLGRAHKSYAGGVDVWNPGSSKSQSMSVNEAGAVAFADYLKKYGVNASAESRAD